MKRCPKIFRVACGLALILFCSTPWSHVHAETNWKLVGYHSANTLLTVPLAINALELGLTDGAGESTYGMGAAGLVGGAAQGVLAGLIIADPAASKMDQSFAITEALVAALNILYGGLAIADRHQHVSARIAPGATIGYAWQPGVSVSGRF